MIALVCGSREWSDRRLLSEFLDRLPITVLVEGCARGADRLATKWAIDRAVSIRHHPVLPEEWRRLGKRAGHIRNGEMLGEGPDRPDIVVAFDLGTPGTADMIDQARATGIPIRRVTPVNHGYFVEVIE